MNTIPKVGGLKPRWEYPMVVINSGTIVRSKVVEGYNGTSSVVMKPICPYRRCLVKPISNMRVEKWRCVYFRYYHCRNFGLCSVSFQCFFHQVIEDCKPNTNRQFRIWMHFTQCQKLSGSWIYWSIYEDSRRLHLAITSVFAGWRRHLPIWLGDWSLCHSLDGVIASSIVAKLFCPYLLRQQKKKNIPNICTTIEKKYMYIIK